MLLAIFPMILVTLFLAYTIYKGCRCVLKIAKKITDCEHRTTTKVVVSLILTLVVTVVLLIIFIDYFEDFINAVRFLWTSVQ